MNHYKKNTWLRVLIADNSILVREQLEILVSEIEGVGLAGRAMDAIEGMQAVERLKPDVVILDITMLGGIGIQTLEMIKAYGTAPVVIVLTLYPSPQYRDKCLQVGAEYFFDKTTAFDRVTEVLQTI